MAHGASSYDIGLLRPDEERSDRSCDTVHVVSLDGRGGAASSCDPLDFDSALKVRAIAAVVDGTLLFLAFGAVYFYKHGLQAPGPLVLSLAAIMASAWILQAVVMRKFADPAALSLLPGLARIVRTGFFFVFLVTLGIAALHLCELSRTLVYGVCAAYIGLEIAAFAVWRFFAPMNRPVGRWSLKRSFLEVSLSLVVADLVLLAVAFVLASLLIEAKLVFHISPIEAVMLMGGIWLMSVLATGKFNKNKFNHYYGAVGTALRSFFVMAAGMALVLFALRIDFLPMGRVVTVLALYLAMEVSIFSLYVAWRRYRRDAGDIEDVEEMLAQVGSSSPVRLEPAPMSPVTEPASEKLQRGMQGSHPVMLAFMKKFLNLDLIDRREALLMNTRDFFDLDMLDRESCCLVVNLHKINDVRWFNRYFILAHTRLKPGGYMVGLAHTISTHKQWLSSRFPFPLDRGLYLLSFIWKRVFPKLPVLKKVYFGVTQGRNRMVSRAEVLGRLCFCGFEIVAEKEEDHRLYFVARKTGLVSTDTNPSYGPLVRLRRSGQGNAPIEVYKFRTMYPYSEYLQEYIHKKQQLAPGGKFNGDFRVTGWGRILRRTWIDELPMFYNWLRGDVQLVGIRPLSEQYLGMYRDDLRELRHLVTPGLVPPFYVDMPKTLDEIMDSEERYIKAFLARPFATQWRYFWKSLWNIGVKGARSA